MKKEEAVCYHGYEVKSHDRERIRADNRPETKLEDPA